VGHPIGVIRGGAVPVRIGAMSDGGDLLSPPSDPHPDGRPAADAELTVEQADALILSRGFAALMLLAAFVGVVVSLAAWCFLEGTVQMQHLLFDHLPSSLGYDEGAPLWYLLLVLGLAGVIVGLTIVRLPGRGGHVPVHGLSAGGSPAQGLDLVGVLLAGAGTIAFGLVLGPEAPLIALGAGLALHTIRLTRREVPQEGLLVVSAAGSFAAVAFIFSSPIIAAVLLIEATGLGGARQRIVLLPGLMAAGIGSLVSIGIGSLSGLSAADYALGPLDLPQFNQPTVVEFAWALGLSVVVALAGHIVLRVGRETERIATPRPLAAAIVVGLLVAGLAFLFGRTTDESPIAVLLSGQDQLPALVARAGTLSLSTLVLLIVFKGVAYGLCMGRFRGGPTFPAVFLGTAGGIVAAGLPGLSTTPAVAICMAAATVTILNLPLSSIVLAILLTAGAGVGSAPLIIVAVVVAHMTTLAIRSHQRQSAAEPEVAIGDHVPAAG
jgi:chloride channel protein, CIC family